MRIVTPEPNAFVDWDDRLPPPGDHIERQYKGRMIRVVVLQEDFEYEGQRFKSDGLRDEIVRQAAEAVCLQTAEFETQRHQLTRQPTREHEEVRRLATSSSRCSTYRHTAKANRSCTRSVSSR